MTLTIRPLPLCVLLLVLCVLVIVKRPARKSLPATPPRFDKWSAETRIPKVRQETKEKIMEAVSYVRQ